MALISNSFLQTVRCSFFEQILNHAGEHVHQVLRKPKLIIKFLVKKKKKNLHFEAKLIVVILDFQTPVFIYRFNSQYCITFYTKRWKVPLAAAVMTAMECLISSIKGKNSSLRSKLFNLTLYLETNKCLRIISSFLAKTHFNQLFEHLYKTAQKLALQMLWTITRKHTLALEPASPWNGQPRLAEIDLHWMTSAS